MAETFSGEMFYYAYKDAEFLNTDVEKILSKEHEWNEELKCAKPGDVVPVDLWLEKTKPVLIRITGQGVIVGNHEFTHNRLRGLTAAYAFENHQRYPVIKCTEAYQLGLTWDPGNIDKCRLYLSAVIGTEHFWKQFGYWPLVCALRKYQLKQIKPEMLVKVAKIKNNEGITMGKNLSQRLNNVRKMWAMFPGSSEEDFTTFHTALPPEIKNVLSAN